MRRVRELPQLIIDVVLRPRKAGLIARRFSTRAVVPFHFSPRYEARAAEFVAEMRAAWAARAAPAMPTEMPKADLVLELSTPCCR